LGSHPARQLWPLPHALHPRGYPRGGRLPAEGRGERANDSSVPIRKRAVILALLSSTALAQGQPAGRWKPADPLPSLAQAYRGQFLVGAAVTSAMVDSARARKFLEQQFDVVVAENEMKPEALSRGEGQYDFSRADAIVDWAIRNGFKVRGHCLVWHHQEMPWMFSQGGKPAPRDVIVKRLRTYIHDVVGHFKGRVWAWDVVNEALVAYEPSIPSENGWRKSRLYDSLGPEYVALAFRFAHEADPDALLFYNDYDTQNPGKRAMILELVRSLRAQGVVIHGIGHQTHEQLDGRSVSDLEATIQAVAATGLRNHITEMDVSLRPRWGEPIPPVTEALRARQAALWAELFRMFRRNRDRIDAVLTWGVNDQESWLHSPDEPLLFSEFQPKPAFWAVLDEASR